MLSATSLSLLKYATPAYTAPTTAAPTTTCAEHVFQCCDTQEVGAVLGAMLTQHWLEQLVQSKQRTVRAPRTIAKSMGAV